MNEPLRTTLTVDAEVRPRFESIAEKMQVKVTEAARRAVTHFVETEELVVASGTASKARDLLTISGTLSNPYQEMLANLRLTRTASQIESISAQHRLELRVDPPETYVLKVLTDLLQKLGKGDEFLVVTNLEFWHNAAVAESDDIREEKGFFKADSAGLYLAAQREAIEKGMRLHRIFLLDAEHRGDCLKQHHQFLSHFKDRNPHVRVDFRSFRDEREVRSATQRLGHFACIRRINPDDPAFPAAEDFGSVVFRPVLGSHGTIDRLEYLFSGSPSSNEIVKFHLNCFLQAKELSNSIEDLFVR